jgi:hypothetical protein
MLNRKAHSTVLSDHIIDWLAEGRATRLKQSPELNKCLQCVIQDGKAEHPHILSAFPAIASRTESQSYSPEGEVTFLC